jgi:hypothetical protein
MSLETTCRPIECCPDDFSMDAAPDASVALACNDADNEHPCFDFPLLMPSGQNRILPTKVTSTPIVEVAVEYAESAAIASTTPRETFVAAYGPACQPLDTLLKQTVVLLI